MNHNLDSFLTEQLDSMGMHICAMLNDKGGDFAVDLDAFLANKIHKPKAEDLNLWESYIRDHLKPSSLFSILRQDNKIWVEIPQGKDVPYAYHDVVYIWSEGKAQKAPIEIVRDMIQRKQIEPERWERRFSLAKLPEDLDQNEIEKQIKSIQETQRVTISDPIDHEKVLILLSVIKYGRLTNAGDVLFSHNTALRYPQVRIRATCYPTDKTDDAYTDMKLFEGPLLQVLDEVYRFILRNTATRVSFRTKGTARINQTQYPEAVIREALVNALVHRDYSSYTGGLYVHIFPHRIEIFNSGSFLEGVTPEKLLTESVSILRNPDIAHIVYLNGRMEKSGRGSQMIVKICKEFGLQSPIWRSEEGVGVTLVLSTMEENMEVTMDDAMEVSMEVKKMVELFSGEISRKEIQELLNLANAEHVRLNYIIPSIEHGLIEMTRSDVPQSRLQKYRLTPKGKVMQEKLKRKTRKE